MKRSIYSLSSRYVFLLQITVAASIGVDQNKRTAHDVPPIHREEDLIKPPTTLWNAQKDTKPFLNSYCSRINSASRENESLYQPWQSKQEAGRNLNPLPSQSWYISGKYTVSARDTISSRENTQQKAVISIFQERHPSTELLDIAIINAASPLDEDLKGGLTAHAIQEDIQTLYVPQENSYKNSIQPSYLNANFFNGSGGNDMEQSYLPTLHKAALGEENTQRKPAEENTAALHLVVPDTATYGTHSKALEEKKEENNG